MKRRTRILRTAMVVTTAITLGIQLVPVDRANPPVISSVTTPGDIDTILRRACYDCHSHETAWPWYSHVAPASWFVARHVERGRSDLNFSDWPTFDFELQENTYRDIEEQIVKSRMPLKSYLLLHPTARLDDSDRDLLLAWVRAQTTGNN